MLKQICEKNFVVGEHQVIQGIAHLEEDVPSNDPTMKAEFMDAHGLLLELQDELGQLTDKTATHVGVGFASNPHMVKVVEMISVKPIMVNQLGQTEDGMLEIRGHALDQNAGLYAARIVAVSNMKKELAVSGPSQISMNKQSGEFRIQIKAQIEDLFYSQADPKLIEIFVSRR